MAVVSVKQALSGAVAANSEVSVRGWVRTRRDSKAGLSFVKAGPVHETRGFGYLAWNVFAPGSDSVIVSG